MKYISILLIMLSVSISILAQQRNLSECIQIATQNGHVANPVLSGTASKSKSMKPSDGNEPYYIFNDILNRKFAIVSGDKRMVPLLGYGEGTYGDSEIPDGLMDVLRGYERAYTYIQSLPFADGYDIINSDSTAAVAPLLSTLWGQDKPFNNYTPTLNDGHTATGCVATAMAQIMRYHGYPERGTGNFSYTTMTNKFNVSEDFSQTVFDWAKMKDSYSSAYSDEQATAVATLMKFCGVSVGMDYDSESGAYSFDVPYALINNFGYNQNIQYYDRDYFTDEEWKAIIEEELHNKRPIFYTGAESDSGHAFVLDGVDADGLYHFNWGWRGAFDGYFSIDALNPYEYDFSSGQEMVCHIQPKVTDTKEIAFYAGSFTPVSLVVDSGGELKFNLSNILCCANNTSLVQDASADWTLSPGIYDLHGNLVQIGNRVHKHFGSMDVSSTLSLSISPSAELDGTVYYVRPIVSLAGDTCFTPIRTKGAENDFYKLTIQGSKYILSNDNTFSESGVCYQIADKSASTLKVISGAYSGEVTIPSIVAHEGVEYTVTSLDDRCFMQCDSLTGIILPTSLTQVGEWAFDGCTSLRKVECQAITPPECVYHLTYPFCDVASTAVLYIPKGCLDAYTISSGWNEFLDIREKDFETAITEIPSSDAYVDVYSIQGLYIGNFRHEDLYDQLSSGLYILSGKIVLINK